MRPVSNYGTRLGKQARGKGSWKRISLHLYGIICRKEIYSQGVLSHISSDFLLYHRNDRGKNNVSSFLPGLFSDHIHVMKE